MPKKEKQYEVTTQEGERVFVGSYEWGTPSMEALQRVARDMMAQETPINPERMKVQRVK